MSLRLFFSKPSLVRQRGSQGLSGMSNLYLSTLRIIFNDEQLVAVDKPPGMLSVPGREKRKEVTSLTRSQEWSVVVSTLLAHLKRENSLSPLVAILHVLNEQRGRVPRQDQKFIRYAQRIMKNQCSKEDAQQLWLRLSSLDRSMYGTLPEEFPAELISASDIMEKQFNQRLFHLHRLDQETSGVLMFGKDSKSANYICNQFREHQIQKVYIALVHGNMLQTVPVTGKITFPLSPDVGNAPRQKIDEISGKSSETDYEVILLDDLRYHLYRPFFPELSEETTLVRLLPRTGRTHQLRVHLLGLGFPIIGDRLYCTPERLGLVGESCRLCLHSLELHFKHPISEEEVHLKTINENEGQKS